MQSLIKKLVKSYLQDFVDLEESALDKVALNIWKGSLSINNVALKRDIIQKQLGEGIEIEEAIIGQINIV